MKIKVWFDTNLIGTEQNDVLNVPDDSTDAECEEYFQEWMQERFEGGWSKVCESEGGAA